MRKKNKYNSTSGKKLLTTDLHVKFLNKAINVKAKLYKILLLWSSSDEQQQTDYNWPLHIMRTNRFLFYNT